MNKYAQIFTGGGAESRISWSRVRAILDELEPDGLIIGWAGGQELYSYVSDYAVKRGMSLYLWLPVFSEWKKLTGQSSFILRGGHPAGGTPFSSEESFDFCCVSDPENLDRVEELFINRFSHIPFDGVFLDRVRYPSFSAGIDALFGCSCPQCMEAMEELDLNWRDLEEYGEKIRLRIGDASNANPLGLRAYSLGGWSFEDSLMEKLLSAKGEIIFRGVFKLAERLRKYVHEIGLDLFAPFMGAFVGQDYGKLTTIADFVKPMLYRFTDTPAGFRFELERLIGAISTPESYNKRRAFLEDILDIGGDGSMESLMKTQLAVLKQYSDKVTVGIEAHTISGRDPITAAEIRDNMKLIRGAGFKGITACWDVMEASPENLREIFEERR